MKQSRPSSTPIAIVGVGCRFPKADDLHAFWDNIFEGLTSFSPIPKDRWHHDFFFSTNQRDVDKAWVDRGSFIDRYREFAALHYGIAPRRLEVMDPQQRLLIEATRWAIQDAGYESRDFDRRRTGVFAGISVSEFKNIAQARIHAAQMVSGDYGVYADEHLRAQFMDLVSNIAPMRAFTLSGSLTALNASAVAQVFDLGGPAYAIDAACASASIAIHDAVMQLRAGALDQAVAGGAYINLSPDKAAVFADAFRVLKPGGRLAISDVVLLRELPPALANDVTALTGCVSGAARVEQVQALLEQSGFRDIKVEVKRESREAIKDWLPGSGVEDFVSSA
ncbi:MAG: hypothetical protein HC923_07795, partial [Myxococcales bacterium]|nr:hypothetical protein [Myxococcales bacterium]